MLVRLLPMLGTPAGPFDDPEYLFEIKWDGVRALAAVEEEGWRLWGRGLADYTARYPELAVLRGLPAGEAVGGGKDVLGGKRSGPAVPLLAPPVTIRWMDWQTRHPV